MKTKLICAALVAALTVAACSKSSTGRNRVAYMSDSELNTMGTQSFEQMKEKEKISTDKKLNAYVQCVAAAVTKHVSEKAHQGDWEVVVFDSPQVNAFALPGGKIGVYTEILKVAKTQDQLAAIIGHEVGHVIEGHSNERLSSNQLSQYGLAAAAVALGASDVENKGLVLAGLGLGVQYGVIMPYGRAHESEADIVGQDLMARAGFNPEASIELWQNMAKASGGKAPHEFLSTHPSNQTRIKELTQHLSVSQPLYKSSTDKPSCNNPVT